MKHVLLFFMAVACLFAQQESQTPNIFLQIPAYGQTNYQVPLQYDLNLLDLLLSGNKPIPALTVTGTLTAPGFVPSNSSIISGLGYTPAADPGANGLIYRTAVGTSVPIAFPLVQKGDIFTWSTGPARLPVGPDGDVPIADSTQTLGIRWGPVTSQNSGTYFPNAYIFTETETTALTAGTPATITLSPVPIGINGSDTFHPIYISDGGGVSEAVMITGGTAVSGGSGTITFTPAHNHSSGWTLQNANGGISEALQLCNAAGGGIVQLSAGTITIHGLMDQKTGCSKIGPGMDTTILQVAAGEFSSVQGWRAPEYGYVVDRAANGSGVTRSGYSIDMQGSTQTSVPTNTGSVVFWFNQAESPATGVGVLHSPNPANFLPFLLFGTSANNTIQSSKVIDDPLTSCTNTGAGGYFIQTSGAGNKVLSSYGEAGCQAMFQAGTSAAAGVYAYNTYNIGATTMSAFGQQFDCDSCGPGWKFIGNTVIGNGTSPNCFAAISDDPAIATTDVDFTDNDCLNAGVGYQIAGQGNTIITKNVSISGGHVTSPSVAGVLLQDGINNVSITNLQIDGHFVTPNGIFANSAVSGGIKNINIGSGVAVRAMMDNGIFLSGSSGIVPVDGLSIVGALVTENAVGLNLPSSTPVGHFNIALNNIWSNASDYSFGISGGAAALAELGVGTFGPNVTSSAPAYGLAAIQQGSHGTPFANTALVNGLNSNISTSLQGSLLLSGPTGAYSVGGFSNPYDGQELFAFNATAQTLTIVNEDTSSTAANRIYTFTGANVVLTPASGQNSQFVLKYSIAKARWLLVSHS